MAKSTSSRSAAPAGPVRQHYALATGQKIDGKTNPNKSAAPKSKGGKK